MARRVSPALPSFPNLLVIVQVVAVGRGAVFERLDGLLPGHLDQSVSHARSQPAVAHAEAIQAPSAPVLSLNLYYFGCSFLS